jgi:sialic acid synthase SpsE
MIRDIRNLDMSLGEEKIEIVNSVESARNKLERSIATNKDLKKGVLITENDIHLLSPGDGVKWIDKDQLIGKTLSLNLPKDEIIYLNKIK